MYQGFSRRQFLFLAGGTVALGAAGYGLSRKSLRLGLIGAGIRGKTLAETLARTWWLPGRHADIVAICDVDRSRAEAVRAANWPHAEVCGDYRRIIERDDIRGVLIATPDHWHTLIAVHAMRAGKGVYCEKPISLTIAEGQLLVQVAQRTGSVFQGGTQQRSDWRFQTACALVRDGRLGRVHDVTITLPQRWVGESCGPFPTMAPPPELDWAQWLGQAPWAEYCPQRCHGSFRRWFEYAGGQMTDWGAHHMDIVQWALDMDQSGPQTVAGQGNFPKVANGFNTPIEFSVDMAYANGARVRIRTSSDEKANGIEFVGDAGAITVSRTKLVGPAVDQLAVQPLPKPASGSKTNFLIYHLQEFLTCLDTRATPVSDVVSQHRSVSACHLANIAMRLGRKVTWDAEREQVLGDAEAQAMLQRPQRHPYQIPA